MSQDQDLFDAFTEAYEKGYFQKALQTVISTSQVTYDALRSKRTTIFPFLMNYADAAVFKGALEFRQMHQMLMRVLNQDPRLRVVLDTLIEQFNQEYTFFLATLVKQDQLSQLLDLSEEWIPFFLLFRQGKIEELKDELASLPTRYQPFFRQKIQVMQGWQHFQQARPALASLMSGENELLRQPWHPFAYAQSLDLHDFHPQGEVPLIFLEPLEGVNYADFLAPYSQQECILVVETVAHFFHLLQFTELQTCWRNPLIHLYILELYPQAQFSAQQWRWHKLKTLRPLFMASRPDIERMLSLWQEVLGKSLTQSSADWENDTPLANWLYTLSRNLVWTREAERYGKSRCMAFNAVKGLSLWYDPHKGFPLPGSDKGPPVPDHFKELLEEISKERKAHSFVAKQRIRLAHVVPQIVDGGHAPTRLLKNLCALADSQRFDLFVISTERLAEHSLEYPIATYFSPSSQLRAPETIPFLQNSGVEVLIAPDAPTYQSTAQYINEMLQKLEIDVAVFHGPDEINNWCGCTTDVPIRVFFEHGTPPAYPCYDLAILSTNEGYEQNRENLKQMGMASCALLFSLDVRQGWKKEPESKKALGLPPHSFVLTTISNHLDHRLSVGMCQAIGEILQRCPQAVYAPMGPVRDQERLRAFWSSYGVNERIIFLGHQENPSQVARSMHVYLNEFPFGSCIGMLDAMAAGCAVVSMHDEQGPQQARYAANYLGLDYVVTTQRKEDYVELACRLIQDPEFYQKWSKHALQAYEKRVDSQQYVNDFEKIIENFMDYYLQSHRKNPRS